MLHRRWLRLLAVLLGLALLAAACGDDDDSAETGDDPGTEEPDIRVGLVYDIGGRGDQSFNDAAYAGLSKAEDELGVDTSDLEPNEGGEDREELLRVLAEDGYDMIIGVGFAFAEAIADVSADFTDIRFAIVDEVVEAPNVTSLVFAEEQGSYLVGAAAALTSQSNKLGFIGGVQNDLIKKFEAGFAAGAAKVKPEATVDVKYITQPPDFSGFNDSAKGLEIANAQFGDGADVIYHAAGGSGAGLFKAAADARAAGNNVWSIGVDADQALVVQDTAQRDTILTSMLKRVDVAVFEAIKSFTEGSLEPGVRRFDLANDGIAYATTGDHLSTEIQAQLDDLKQQIIDGTIEVPTAPA